MLGMALVFTIFVAAMAIIFFIRRRLILPDVLKAEAPAQLALTLNPPGQPPASSQ